MSDRSQTLIIFERLQAAGLPVESVYIRGNRVVVRPSPGATDEQKTAIRAISTKPEEDRTVAQVASDVDALGNSTKQQLMNRVMADYIMKHPAVARALSIDLVTTDSEADSEAVVVEGD